jgi:hypothetical protein
MVASVDGVFEESLPLPKIVEGGKVDAVFNCWIFDIGFTERGCGEETAAVLYRRERERLETSCASLGCRSKKGGSHV